MSELPIASPYRSTPELPVSDVVRDQLNRRLNDAYTRGQLEEDDYRGRLDVLFAARRLGELVPVVEGLPPLVTSNDPGGVTSSGGQPGELAPSRDARSLSIAAIAAVAFGIGLIAIFFLVIFLQ